MCSTHRILQMFAGVNKLKISKTIYICECRTTSLSFYKQLFDLYLTGRWSHWTASRHQQSRTGTWWRWPCDWPGWQWRSGHWGSSRPPRGWRRAARPPSLTLSGSNTPPGGRPWRAARTCCCSGPGQINRKTFSTCERRKNWEYKLV